MSFIAGMFAAKRGHAALFSELCKHHNIDAKTVRPILDRIIAAYRVDKPATIFFDPTHLKAAIADPQFAKEKDVLRELCYRWYSVRV
ncbi:MAG: hypothetical protein ACRC46_03315 [Thermoguttaceae bacterium]